jgi:hypothetical protein
MGDSYFAAAGGTVLSIVIAATVNDGFDGGTSLPFSMAFGPDPIQWTGWLSRSALNLRA